MYVLVTSQMIDV